MNFIIFLEKKVLWFMQKNNKKFLINIILKKKFINFNSKILFDAEIYNQIFNTENKLIKDNNYKTGSYYRFFPIFGISTESPFKLKNINQI